MIINNSSILFVIIKKDSGSLILFRLPLFQLFGYVYVLCVYFMRITYVYTLCVCLMCITYVYALCVYHMCIPYVYNICVYLIHILNELFRLYLNIFSLLQFRFQQKN